MVLKAAAQPLDFRNVWMANQQGAVRCLCSDALHVEMSYGTVLFQGMVLRRQRRSHGTGNPLRRNGEAAKRSADLLLFWGFGRTLVCFSSQVLLSSWGKTTQGNRQEVQTPLVQAPETRKSLEEPRCVLVIQLAVLIQTVFFLKPS